MAKIRPVEAALRRQAYQIAAQLPEDGTDALRILDYARALILLPMVEEDRGDVPETHPPLKIVR